MGGWLQRLRQAPWTLWAYVGLSAAVTVVAAVIGDHRYLWAAPIAFAVLVLFSFFLLRGSRVMWWVLVLLELSSLPAYFFGSELWWQAPITLADLALLLAPPSRRYVFKPKPRQSKVVATGDSGGLGPQSSWDPDDHDDANRPPGWYFDPAEPDRMRYWDARMGGWQSKTTRAPRKLRRRAREATAD